MHDFFAINFSLNYFFKKILNKKKEIRDFFRILELEIKTRG